MKLASAAVYTCDYGTDNTSTTCIINSTKIMNGSFSFTNILIGSNGSLTHSANSNVQNFSINISCVNLTIEAGGRINISGRGYGGGALTQNGNGTGGGTGRTSTVDGAGGAGHGGNGGTGTGTLGPGGPTYDSITQPTQIGSGGGGGLSVAGGAGGGLLTINATGTINITGTINANGITGAANANYPGAGGSGGSIYLTANTITGTGNITANGGDGGTGTNRDAGGGAGGRIAIYYTTNTYTGIINNKGGNGDTAQHGGAGTTYLKSSAETYGGITINNQEYNTGVTNITETITINWLNITNATINSTNIAINITDIFNMFPGKIYLNTPIKGTSRVTIYNGTTLAHTENSANQTHIINITCSNFTLESGAIINISGKGYTGGAATLNGSGPGGGTGRTSTVDGAGGAGHGGNGGTGTGTLGPGGPTYDSITQPTQIGSGGGGGLSVAGGAGGGLLTINATGTINITGTINANGTTGLDNTNYPGGGGSGGSIYLTANTITGTGNITTNGGNGGTGTYRDAGGGAGGRISINYQTNTYTGTINNKGGNGDTAQHGGAGTTYLKASSETYGGIIINNQELNTGITNITNDYTFNWANLTNTTINSSSVIINVTDQLNILPGITYLNTPIIGTSRVTIQNGSILTHTENSANQTHFINITCTNLTIQEGGIINTSYKGYSGGAATLNGSGPGGGIGRPSTGGGGPGGAGHGGNGGRGLSASDQGGPTYDSITQPTQIGSGGGGGYSVAGGTGGGLIIIQATNKINITGTIIANGFNGTYHVNYPGAGGSGGSIYLTANTITGTGNITANGGNGATGANAGGGGAGGRIAIYYTTNTYTGTINNKGENGNGNIAQHGGAGTTYLKQTSETYGGIIINNQEYNTGMTNITTDQEFNWLNITNATIIGNNINITDQLNILPGITYLNAPIIGTSKVNVQNGATLSHTNNTDTQQYILNITCTNLTIQEGGSINTFGRGYAGGLAVQNGSGPGAGIYGIWSAGGAGHAGKGGRNAYAAGTEGNTYGNITAPTTIGSGGGGGGESASSGGSGGGLIIINATNTINITGTINANGANGTTSATYGPGGGSGGSIYLTANTITGTGNITANGGKGITTGGSWKGGGAGGGRIAIYYNTYDYTGNIQAKGETGYENGGAGTTYLKSSTETYGGIIINNQELNTGITNITDSYTFNWANITNATIQGTNITANPINITNTTNILPGTTYLNTPIKGTSNVIIQNGATLTHTNNTDTQNYYINITCTNLTIESGASINVKEKGYVGGAETTNGSGPGKGIVASTSGGGGGLGGNGGTGSAGTAYGGSAYDSITSPTQIGSGGGGGGSNSNGGNGGGLIIINAAGTITNNGTMTAAGGNGSVTSLSRGPGGGAGGGIWLIANTITGTGTINASGGHGYNNTASYFGGGGAGGRISLNYITNAYTGTIEVKGGTGSGSGQNGTLFKCKTINGVSCPGIVGGVGLSTISPNASINLNRSITTPIWNQSYLKWNDTTDYIANFSYNISGLIPGRKYDVYNYSNKLYTLLADEYTTTLEIFTINSSAQHEIIVREANESSTRLNSPVDGANLSSIPVIFNCTAMSNYELNNVTLYINYTGWHANETKNIDGISNTTTFSKSLPDGFYTWNCYSCDSTGSCTFALLNRTFVLDTQPSNVTLIFPANQTVVDTYSTEFTYNVSDNNLIFNCSFIINDVVNQTNSTITRNTNQTFTLTVPYGNFNWTVNCTDRSLNIGTGGRFRYIDTTAPTINITSPINNSLWPLDNVSFIYNVTDPNNILNCSLYINDQLNQTHYNVTKNTALTFTNVLPDGNYNFTINCTDRSLNMGTGGRFNFTINDTTPPNITIVNPINASWLINTSTWTLINLSTDENASCKYNLTNPSFDFSTQGTRFNITGNKTHTFNYTGLVSTYEYNLYYKCNDTKNNINPVSVHHQFSIAEGICDRGNYSTTCWINSTRKFNGTTPLINNLIIESNGTLTHGDNTIAQNASLNLTCVNLTIYSGGSINVTGKGYTGGVSESNGNGPGGGIGYNNGAGGGGHGGNGGLGDAASALGGKTYGNITNPTTIGSGGGGANDFYGMRGGDGGGLVIINCTTISNNGTITARGENSYPGGGQDGGGGAGGSIWIIANTITGNGEISSNGGNSNNSNWIGGGGAGGRIAIYYTTNTFNGNITAKGGNGQNDGGPGTIYLKAIAEEYGGIIISNLERDAIATTNITDYYTFNWLNATNATINSTNVQFNITDSVNIMPGTLYLDLPIIGTGSVLIQSGATLTHTDNTNTQRYVLNITCNNLTIESGAAINLSGKGYSGGVSGSSGNGPGGGIGSISGGGGAGHGGNGGKGLTGAGGSTYGNITNPTTIGSGGGGGSAFYHIGGGAGGGLVIIQATGTISNNGIITARGQDGESGSGQDGGGGAGGSIWITANAITGNGEISSNGGNESNITDDGGGGAGGRIAIYYTTNTFSGIISAKGDGGYQNGGAGTIYIKSTTESYGGLIINNYNRTTAITNITDNYTFNWANITNATIIGNPINLTDDLNVLTGALWLNNSLAGNSTITIFPSATVYFNNPTTITAQDITIQDQSTAYFNSVNINARDIITENQSTTYFNSPFISARNILLKAGSTVSQRNNNTVNQTYYLNITCVNMTIESGASLNTDYKGYTGATTTAGDGNGPGGGNGTNSCCSYGGGGAGHGGNGGNGNIAASTGGNSYGSITQPATIGSGGGAYNDNGGDGGGLIIIQATNTINITGNITAKGENGTTGSYGGGGGSGGSIWITTNTITGSGIINVHGGNGGSNNAGGGAGGRIAIEYATNTYTGTMIAQGGNGYSYGGAGTIYLKQNSETYGGIIINNNAGSTGITNITDDYTFNWANITNATIQGTEITSNPINITDTLNILPGTLYLNTPIIGTSNIIIQNGSTLRHTGNTNTQQYWINISCINFTLVTGGSIDTDYKGYTGATTTAGDGNGPGGGNGTNSCCSYGGGGAGHGGNGGNGNIAASTGGLAYGSRTQPTTIGSGGGAYNDNGGDGGGLIIIQATNKINITGNITAKGENGTTGSYGGGAGSAGSIYLTARNITGTGTINADGGNGQISSAGGGAGGRIALIYTTYCDETTFVTTITNTTTGGTGYQNGENGTIFYGCVNNPPNISLSKPGNDSDQPRASINFSWIYSDSNNDPQWAYELMIDNDSDFSSPEFNLSYNTTNSSIVLAGFNATTYYWKARVLDFDTIYNESGDWSDWTDVWQFLAINITINWVNASPNPAIPGQNINITANVTGGAINRVKVLFNGTYYPMTNGGSGNIYWNDSVSTMVSANHIYTVFANDSSGNEISMDGSVLVSILNISIYLTPNPVFTSNNFSVYGHANQSDGTNASNNVISIFMNGSKYYYNNNAALLENTTSWWNTSFAYRTKINITNLVSTNLNNTIALVNLSTSDLISTSKMRTDCGDTRFIDANGNELPYTLETSTCNTTNTMYWVWVNLTGNANNTIWIYHGNNGSALKTDYTNPDSSLVLYLHFDNSSAYGENNASVYDFSRKGFNMTISNATWTSSGRFGGAYNFTPSKTSYLNTTPISIPANITMSAWVYSNNYDQNGFIISKMPVNTQWEIFFQNDNYIYLRGGSATSVTAPLPTNSQWHHIAGVINGTTGTIYVDGIRVGGPTTITAINNGMTGGTNDIVIGSYDKGVNYLFNGSIDEVRLYNRSLSSNEILAIYNSTVNNYINNHNLPRTDSNGDYNYTLIAPSTPGSYEIKVNTTYNGMIAENTATLTVEQGYINISLNINPNPGYINSNISFYGRVNESNGAGVPNNKVEIYINNSLYVENTNTGLLELTTMSWWNSNWLYRTKINITSSVASKLNNTIVLVNLSTSDLISQGKMNSDCGDTRFTDSNGNELQYTMETSTCNTANTTYWVWMNLTGNTNNTVYAYYGNIASTVKTDYTNPDQKLSLYMHLDNSSVYGENSSKFYDFSKSGNNGSCTNCPNWNSSGRYGGGYAFNGTSNYINITNTPFNFTGNFSIAIWVYFKKLGATQSLVSKAEGGAYELFLNVSNHTGMAVYSGGAYRYAYSTNKMVIGQWYHLVAVVNNTNVTLYVNGTLQNTMGALSGAVTSSTYALTLGANPGSPYIAFFNGTMDEVRVYNRTLSADEILAIYNSTANYYIQNHSLPMTDGSGNYNYTWTAPNTPGSSYEIKVNTTYYSASAEDTGTLTVLDRYMNITLNLNPNPVLTLKNLTISGHINESDGTNVTNNPIKIYINDSEVDNTQFNAIGGTITTILDGGLNYTIHTFLSNGTFNIPEDMNVTVLVVAGGGGGGHAESGTGGDGAGGGGGGGFLTDTFVITKGSHEITVGLGGSGSTDAASKGANGGNSSIDDDVVALGGGGGGSDNHDNTNIGADGGSGGGAASKHDETKAGGSGDASQGHNGGSAGNWLRGGGGGGGAFSAGVNSVSNTGANGGNGSASNISGSPVNYSGGGGGGSCDNVDGGTGGSGGGSKGGWGWATGDPGDSATANTGGGGGGGGAGGTGTAAGGSGGSGIVIIRYLTLPRTDANGNYNYTFTAPATAGNYIIKVNTTYNGMSAEKTSNLTVNQNYINISLNLNPNPVNISSNVSIYGHVNETDGTNVVNNPVNVYINSILYYYNNNTGLLENTTSWWNTSFGYRTKINVTSLVSTSLNNTITLVNLSTSTLVAQGKMKSDCGDTRFTDINGNELQYTIETSTCNSTNTIFWVWMNLTGNANNTVWAYYGNSGATSAVYTSPDQNLVLLMHLDSKLLADSSRDYSNVSQGTNNWYYYWSAAGSNTYTQLVQSTSAYTWVVANPSSSYEFLYEGQSVLHPGSTTYQDPVRAWSSTVTGQVTILATISDGDAGGGDGINYTINQNTQQLFTQSYANGFAQTTINLTINVSVGDMIYFRVNRKSDQNWDTTNERIQIFTTNPLIDSSGRGNNGTDNGAIQNASGRYGGAFQFDGTNDYVSVADSNSLDATNAITISAWINPTSVNNKGILMKGALTDSQGVYSLLIDPSAGNPLRFRLNGGIADGSGQASSTTDMSTKLNTWTHVVGTYNGSRQKVYINGVLEGNQSYSTAISADANPLYIGGYYSTSYLFPGMIDDVRIYNRSLSTDEILAIYNSTANYYIQNHSLPMTDGSGNYNYTFTAPSTAGNYPVKVNITYNSMSAEATGTLTVQASGGVGVNCTAYKCFITRSNGNPVAIFDALGALDLKASLTQSASSSPGANDFIIRNSTGTPVAWINASGNFFIKGTLSENNGVACTPPTNSFFIKGNNSECVAYVNNTGDLWIKGDLRESVLT